MSFDQAINIPEGLISTDVAIALLGEKLRYNIRIKQKDIALAKTVSGLKLPSKINKITFGKNTICMKLGPDEWIVRANATQKKTLESSFTKLSKIVMCSITDISHRNVGFEITGKEAAHLINVGCPLNLSLDSFPIGKASRTVFESVPIVVLRLDNQMFQIECWRSFGPYLRDYFMRVLKTC